MTRSNIATAINDAHAGVEAAKKEGTRYAIEAGRLLVEAKATVMHGKWDGWIRENCTFSPRTARLYISIFQHVQADPAKRQRVAEMAIRDVARELAKPTAARALSNDGRKWLIDLVAAWVAIPFRARKQALDELVAKGQMDAETYVHIMRVADKDDYDARLVSAIRRDFGQGGMADLVASFDATVLSAGPAPKGARNRLVRLVQNNSIPAVAELKRTLSP